MGSVPDPAGQPSFMALVSGSPVEAISMGFLLGMISTLVLWGAVHLAPQMSPQNFSADIHFSTTSEQPRSTDPDESPSAVRVIIIVSLVFLMFFAICGIFFGHGQSMKATSASALRWKKTATRTRTREQAHVYHRHDHDTSAVGNERQQNIDLEDLRHQILRSSHRLSSQRYGGASNNVASVSAAEAYHHRYQQGHDDSHPRKPEEEQAGGRPTTPPPAYLPSAPAGHISSYSATSRVRYEYVASFLDIHTTHEQDRAAAATAASAHRPSTPPPTYNCSFEDPPLTLLGGGRCQSVCQSQRSQRRRPESLPASSTGHRH
ncbi:hypothetical protein B0T17DRAFT_655132 [Bombardia bombarda]|uniref:Uncharacterized protein n=1 Tax=Bombardia bombarda TaxID=252184 RepID=A0AA39X170_9PEZI|nr:hypothetical protein B0T17DRAFT_655132 [Bombardia bombarda]